MENAVQQVDTVAIAKRFFGTKSQGAKVDCVERDFDYMWEMIKFMEDPTLDQLDKVSIIARGLQVPGRWVTVDVVKPFVIEGIKKSLNNKV